MFHHKVSKNNFNIKEIDDDEADLRRTAFL